jgi:PAP2 superfamily
VTKLSLTSQQREWLIPFLGYLVIVLIANYRVHELYDSDFAFLILILAALALGRVSSFIRDWTPVVLLLFSYEYLHGYADKIIGSVHSTDIIHWEEKLFGYPVATVTLQRIFYTPGVGRWYDYASGLIYYAHSFVVLFVAFGLWVYRRELYLIWARLYVYLSFAGFVTYILFPAMPPWMASQHHLIPHIHKIIDEVMPDGTVGMVSAMTSNLVAAMPSLHAAYPTLGFLFMVRHFRKAAPVYGAYCLVVYFAIIYLGEHYILDTLAGIGYALGVFYINEWVTSRKRHAACKSVPVAGFDGSPDRFRNNPLWSYSSLQEHEPVPAGRSTESRV